MKRRLHENVVVLKIIMVALCLFVASSTLAQQDELTSLTGKKAYVEHEDKLVEVKILRVNAGAEKVYVQTVWYGRRKAWVAVKELLDKDGWPLVSRPFDEGEKVEMQIEGVWMPGVIEKIKNQRAVIRLDVDGVRVAPLDKLRMPRIRRKPTGDQAKQNQQKQEPANPDETENKSTEADPNSFFDATTGEWRALGVTHPRSMKDLKLDSEVYVPHENQWRKATVTVLARSECTVALANQAKTSIKISPHDISLTPVQTVFDNMRFHSLRSGKIIHSGDNPAASGRLPDSASGETPWTDQPWRIRSEPPPGATTTMDSAQLSGGGATCLMVSYKRQFSKPQSHHDYRILVYDTVLNRMLVDCAAPSGWKPLAVNPSGDQIVLVDENDLASGKLMLLQVSDPQQPMLVGLKLELSPQFKLPGKADGSMVFVDDQHLLIQHDYSNAAVMINTFSNKHLWTLTAAKSIVVRKDGRLLACVSDVGLTFIELPTGRVVGHGGMQQGSPFLFSGDGERLALKNDDWIDVYDLSEKKTAIHVPAPRSDLTHLIGDFGFYGAGQVYNFTVEAPIWRYTGAADVLFSGDRCIFLYKGETSYYALPVQLPVDRFEKIASNEDLIRRASAVIKGTPVRLQVNVGGEAGAEAKKRLTQQAQERGWLIDNQADIVLEAHTKAGESKQQEYVEMFTRKRHTIRENSNYSYITIRRGDEVFWRTTGYGRGSAGGVIHRNDKRTMQQRADEEAQGHLRMFYSFVLPQRVMKAAYQYGFGKNALSATGLKPAVRAPDP